MHREASLLYETDVIRDGENFRHPSQIPIDRQSTLEIYPGILGPCLVSYVADGPIEVCARIFLRNDMYMFFRSSIGSVDYPHRKRLIKTRRRPKGGELSSKAIKL